MTRTSRQATFFVATALLLLALVTHVQEKVLPASLAAQVGHNSEALLFALLVSATVHLHHRLLGQGKSPLPVLASVAVVLGIAGLLLQRVDAWPTSVVTLNEAVLGAGLVAAYLCLPRSPWFGALASLAVVIFIVIFFQTGFVLDQAESLVPLALAPLALDVFDRRILSPDLPDRPGLRRGWMAFLVLMAVVSMFAARWARGDLDGAFRLAIDYSQRAAEAYWGWLIIHAYFSYWLPGKWLPRRKK